MRRGSRSGNSIASYTPAARDTPATSDIYGTQANGGEEKTSPPLHLSSHT